MYKLFVYGFFKKENFEFEFVFLVRNKNIWENGIWVVIFFYILIIFFVKKNCMFVGFSDMR